MSKIIALMLFSLSLSVPARAATIVPDPAITKFDAWGSIHAQTVVDHPYSSEGSVQNEQFTAVGQTMRKTSSSASIATIDLSHAPSVSSRSEAGVHPTGSTIGESTAALIYYFKILGPTTTSIPVLIQAKGQTKVSGPLARASAFLKIVGFRSYVINEGIETEAGEISNGIDFTPRVNSFTVDGYYDLVSNNEYMIQLNAYSVAANGNSLPGPSLASAFVDPFLSIDPRFSDYSLAFSGGISNSLVSPVPIPAALPLFGTALLVLGSLGYGVKRRGDRRGRAALAV